MATITFKKEKLVEEDVDFGLGESVQSRGIGKQVNADSIPYDMIDTVKTKLDKSADTADLDAYALKNGNSAEKFEVADGTTPTEAVSKSQMETALADKADDATAAKKDNVLERDNTDVYTPTGDYNPTTKKYVDDTVVNIGAGDMRKSTYDTDDSGYVDTAEAVGTPASALGVSSQDQVMRVAQVALTDCNTTPNTLGMFQGDNPANGPLTGPLVIEQFYDATTGYKAQRGFDLTTRDSFLRMWDTVVWGAWERVLNETHIQNDLVGSALPYEVLHADQGRVLNTEISNVNDTLTAEVATKVKWNGIWSAGEYIVNDMVIDNVWTMIANKTTTDQPSPQTVGEPIDSIVDPVWDDPNPSTNATVISGNVFTFTKTGILNHVRIYTPEKTDVTYGVIVDINGESTVYPTPATKEGGWSFVSIAPRYILAGDIVTVTLQALKAVGNTAYAEMANYWPTNQPSFATVTGTLSFDGVPQSVANNAYGADLQFHEATISVDWDIVAKSGGGVGAGGGAGTPDARDKNGYTLMTRGTKADDSEWSPIRVNPNVLTQDFAMEAGTSGTVTTGFTIADGVTLTIPDGSVVSVV